MTEGRRERRVGQRERRGFWWANTLHVIGSDSYDVVMDDIERIGGFGCDPGKDG